MPAVQNLTEMEFQKKIESETLMVVDFWAEWCGPCRLFSPVFDEVAKDWGGVDLEFCKVNVDQAQDMAVKFQVRSIPTLMLMRGDEILESFSGSMGKGQLEAWIREHA